MKEIGVEELKKIQMDILIEVDKWCKEHNVNYFIDCGTLIGAVRHKGYIPWDDDIDISMLREDYEAFIKEFNKNRNDDLEVMHARTNKGFPYEFAKVQKKNTRMIEKNACEFDIGINIDIFPYDYLAPTKDMAVDRANKLLKKCKIPQFVFEWKLTLGNKLRKRPLHKRIIVDLFKFITLPFSVDWCTHKMDTIATTYYNTDYKYLSGMCSRRYNAKEFFEREWMKNTIDIEFEGHTFKAPSNYDMVLRAQFGDYMQLPPEEQRVSHHEFKAYILN